MSDVVDAVATPVEVKKIDELSLARLLRFADRDRANQLELAISGAALNKLIEEWIKTSPEAQKHADRLAQLRGDQEKVQKDYTALVTKVEAQLGVSLKDYVVDDDTGELKAPPAPAPATIVPPSA